MCENVQNDECKYNSWLCTLLMHQRKPNIMQLRLVCYMCPSGKEAYPSLPAIVSCYLICNVNKTKGVKIQGSLLFQRLQHSPQLSMHVRWEATNLFTTEPRHFLKPVEAAAQSEDVSGFDQRRASRLVRNKASLSCVLLAIK